MGTGESHRCREVAIVERFKQESVYNLSAQKMPIVEMWLLGKFQLYLKHVSSNISNMRCSVSSPDETPRRELKIRRAAEYF